MRIRLRRVTPILLYGVKEVYHFLNNTMLLG